MSARTALLDASVLYPAPLRDVLLQLAAADLYRARWTEAIHDEWINALLRNEPHRNRDALERTRTMMNTAALDALVDGYEALIPTLVLPDPNDRHVFAAAITGGCDTIVTANLKDFPAATLEPHGVRAQHPDAFLRLQLDRTPDNFCAAIRTVRARLKNPAYPAERYLKILEGQGLHDTAAALRTMQAAI
ncbi:MAG: PIN domain-containing protein [Beijerinckiaceae bacterium]